jgi:hypothetical protein
LVCSDWSIEQKPRTPHARWPRFQHSHCSMADLNRSRILIHLNNSMFIVVDRSANIINTIMDVVAAKKGGEFGFNLWPRKCAECLKFMTSYVWIIL